MSKYTLEDFINLPEVVKTLRKKKKLSQRKLANKIGVCHQAVWSYEKGNIKPSIETLFRIMNVCGYTFEIKEDIYKTPKKINLP